MICIRGEMKDVNWITFMGLCWMGGMNMFFFLILLFWMFCGARASSNVESVIKILTKFIKKIMKFISSLFLFCLSHFCSLQLNSTHFRNTKSPSHNPSKQKITMRNLQLFSHPFKYSFVIWDSYNCLHFIFLDKQLVWNQIKDSK